MKGIRASSNLAMLEFIARSLGDLKDELVFLGGCTTALFITDQAVPDVRATMDVDCIVDVASVSDYYQLEKKLVERGFYKDPQDDMISRWRYDDAILDIMPADKKILGFNNDWYHEAINNIETRKVSDNLSIKVVKAPYFLATKLEAFNNRGNGDFLLSHDLEDIITVVDGRLELVDEVSQSNKKLKEYLAEVFGKFINEPLFLSALPGHLNYGSVAQERTNVVLGRIKQFAEVS